MAKRNLFKKMVVSIITIAMLAGMLPMSALAAKNDRYDDYDRYPNNSSNYTLYWCYDEVSTNGRYGRDLELANVTFNDEDWDFGDSVQISSRDTATITVTPVEGYRVTKIDMLCTNRNNNEDPYDCNTYDENASYKVVAQAGSKIITISDFETDNACNHASGSKKYYMMVTVEEYEQEPAYSVTYVAGQGQGQAYTDSDLEFLDEYEVKAFDDDNLGFQAPAGKEFAGWEVTECEDDSETYGLLGEQYDAGDSLIVPAGDVTLTAVYKDIENSGGGGSATPSKYNIPIKVFVLDPKLAVPANGADLGQGSYYPSATSYFLGRYTYEANLEGALSDEIMQKLANSDRDNKLDIGDKLLVESNEGITLPSDWKDLFTRFGLNENLVEITAYVIKVQYPNKYVGAQGNEWYGYDERGNEADIHIDCYISNVAVDVTYHSNFGQDQQKEYEVKTGDEHDVVSYAATQLPTREGYSFEGWATSENGSVQYEAGDSFLVVGNTHLWAVWNKNPDPIPEPEPEPVEVTVDSEIGVMFSKKVSGDDYAMVGDDFTFVVKGTEITATNDEYGEVLIRVPFTHTFMDDGEITTAEKSFSYTIAEQQGTIEYMNYDDSEYTLEFVAKYEKYEDEWYAAEVVVTSQDCAVLEDNILAKLDGSELFVNNYDLPDPEPEPEPEPVEVTINSGIGIMFSKKVSGDDYAMVGDDFTFVVKGTEIAATNDEYGYVLISVPFTHTFMDDGEITTAEKSFSYTIAEQQGAIEHMNYDDSEYTLEVVVKYEKYEDEWYEAEVVVTSQDCAVLEDNILAKLDGSELFVNNYDLPDPEPEPEPDDKPGHHPTWEASRPDPDPQPEPEVVELPDEDVPLAELPEIEVPLAVLPEIEVPLTDIPDEDVPKTGHNSSGALAGLVASLLCLAVALKKKED